MKTELTFILPTRNRLCWVKRAINSCLACENSMIKPHVIVIDGQSDNGTFADLKKTYTNDAKVELFQNNKIDGFMTTCFQGVDRVKTEFATFMYDDDILSPYFRDMILRGIKSKRSFVMGYGYVYRVDDVYPFKPISEFNYYPNLRLLLGYFGRVDCLAYSGLPASPICCVVTTTLLRKWVTYVNRFAKKNGLREYFMLKRNIGPDLMIYFSAIIDEPREILVASATVAQFSAHSNSMTVRYENTDLAIGYWLARIWAFECLCEKGYREEAAICAIYILLFGIRIILKKLRNLELSWLKSICVEMAVVCWKGFKQRMVISTLRAVFPLLYFAYNRFVRNNLPTKPM